MSTIHFIGGEKGGVGKSVLSRLLSQYYLDNSLVFQGFDADQSHSTLSRYYKDYTKPVNLDHFESMDEMMELAAEKEGGVLIDLPAQSQRFLDNWIDENGFVEMCDEMGIQLAYWYAVDDGPDSAGLLSGFLDKYRAKMNIIIAKNLGRGSDFSHIETMLDQYKNPCGEKCIHQFYIPALHAPTMHKIEMYGLSFWAAANLKDNRKVPHLNLMERQRTKVWLNKTYQSISKILNDFAS